ncbi:MAG: hypothetical protein INR69_02695 [Mucilaginibacter polytrichastri]|nr:hypothetical protein [Mucilaginibacter polytrichastri]
MIHPQVKAALSAALKTAGLEKIEGETGSVIASEQDFLDKVAALDAVVDEEPRAEHLREYLFDLLMVNFFRVDTERLEADYMDSPEWEEIEEQTIDRGTELLNLLLYINECQDEKLEPELSDFLSEFLLVDDDEFQDEHRIYEPIIANQALMESSAAEIARVAKSLPDESELKELFYPLMSFFHTQNPSAAEKEEIRKNAPDAESDMPVFAILETYNKTA